MVAHWVLAKAPAGQNGAVDTSLEFERCYRISTGVCPRNLAEAADLVIVESRDQSHGAINHRVRHAGEAGGEHPEAGQSAIDPRSLDWKTRTGGSYGRVSATL
jgi:hypothetical protein